MTITKPKRKSRILTEDKILQAAITIFSKFGFEKASLKQIGEKAGINEALIIRYYGSKAKLLVAIHKEYLDNLDLVIGDHPMCDSLEEEIKSYLLREMNSDLKNIDMRRIIISRASLDVKFRKEIES
ncbi:TetR/AcrR family transcriptional regulator, partial [bacterium]